MSRIKLLKFKLMIIILSLIISCKPNSKNKINKKTEKKSVNEIAQSKINITKNKSELKLSIKKIIKEKKHNLLFSIKGEIINGQNKFHIKAENGNLDKYNIKFNSIEINNIRKKLSIKSDLSNLNLELNKISMDKTQLSKFGNYIYGDKLELKNNFKEINMIKVKAKINY